MTFTAPFEGSLTEAEAARRPLQDGRNATDFDLFPDIGHVAGILRTMPEECCIA